MSLVYLDTSHFSQLAQLRDKDPLRYNRFLSVWRAKTAELALSRIHVQELRRHADRSVRASRLGLIRELRPIRLDLALNGGSGYLGSLGEREALHALVSAGLVTLEGDDLDLRRIGFPTRITNPQEIDALAAFEDPQFAEIFERYHAATRWGVRAETRRPGVPHRRTRLKELGAIGRAKSGVRSLHKEIRKLKTLPATGRIKSGMALLGKSFLTIALSPVLLPFAELTARTLERRLRVQGDSSAKSDFIDYLIAQSTVRRWVEHVLRGLGFTKNDARQTAQLIHLRDAPGAWLAFEVKQRLQSATPMPQVSDHFDLEHLGYLPYVDLFFADKKIRELTHQVLRSKGLPVAYEPFRGRIVSAGTVDGIEHELANRL
jgi:hypothetical protein